MRNIMTLFGALVLIFSCQEEQKLSFTEINTLHDNSAIVEINIPKAQGNTILSKAINSTLEKHIANILNFSEEDSDTIQLSEAIKQFEAAYNSFKSDYEENALVWEAVFDAELIYQSEEVISIAINGYTNTGGAHGNMNITLYNFEVASGNILNHDGLIEDMDAFKEVVERHFLKEIKASDENISEDYFFDDGFHLPANIGFTEEGVLILYNVYEIGSYAQGITEFTIPFEEVNAYLKVH